VSAAQPGLFATEQPIFNGDPLGERLGRATMCARLAAFFKARPGEWIDGRDLATVAGAYGWRTRVSDLRRQPYNLTIENRPRREDGYTRSEYRFVVPGLLG
jgi:hypothetical protein